ncbi:hypothetical protein C5167_036969 [Papaver somniferum]|uniref:Uncharacterized protein n=1 Tax=Papaver somniferum TaxID=3469 RepID=A0A4Y7I9F5_PAPSO|nr:hypothetical protein C5167_036969 [Papaver somniferum]
MSSAWKVLDIFLVIVGIPI